MDAENVEIIIVDKEEDLGDQGEDTSTGKVSTAAG